jgi:pimeloyl-ACP methyl ester carboxylesterase
VRPIHSLLPLLFVLTAVPASADPAAPRTVEITAPDGVTLKATYYAASTPGPAVMLLHMCNTDRRSWEPLGGQLSAAGIHTLALDYRGYGESAGARFDALSPQERQKLVTDKWPGDVDAALAYLVSQPGVDKARLGAAGGSCGVTQAVRLATRHPGVKSLVLLAGPTDRAGREFLRRTTWLPIFASAAADDQFDANAPESMRWLTELSGNPRNKFVGFADGKHGTEMFVPHPELPQQIVAWYVDTLVKAPADPAVAITPTKTPASEFWAILDQPGGVARAVQVFHDARQRDPHVFLFPEFDMNQAGYERLQAGQSKDAIELFKLNAEAYPTSANAQDSLGDGYFADGQHALALAASQKCLALLPSDKNTEQVKNGIRQSAEQKIAKITAPPPK